MTTADIIALCHETGPFLVIGGHAVIAHGHARNTIDLDLLVRREDRSLWKMGLMRIGYVCRNSHDNFEQFQSQSGDIDVDLMFVNAPTFDGMMGTAKEINFGSVSARVPSLLHLIALKLHVLKQGLEHRVIGDLDDVIQLILLNRVDVNSAEWKEVFAKHGNKLLYEKIRRATSPD
ncbi:MAG: hypothetical protein AB1813_12430 [Verrucomicrobiota bacterium]|jgi:hypothetical protein